MRIKSTVLLLSMVFISVADMEVDIDRQGKRIQTDGFLLEWSSKTARQWGESWHWDAVNTPEGVAGYFSSGDNAVCSAWVFSIEPSGAQKEFEIRIPEKMRGEFYTVDEQRFDSLNAVTVEWVIPWSALDTTGGYALSISAKSSCGDTLDPLLLTGSRQRNISLITPRLITQALLIVILLVVYFYIRKKVIKKSKG